MTQSCSWLMQNYRHSKKTKLFPSLLLEILGRGGWLGIKNIWALYHIYIAPFAPSCPLPPFCSGADGNGSSYPWSWELLADSAARSAPRALSNPWEVAGRTSTMVSPAGEKTQAKRRGTNLNFILESRYQYATCQRTKSLAPNCIMPSILLILCHFLKQSWLRWRMNCHVISFSFNF